MRDMEYPATLPISELISTHPELRPEKIADYQAFYYGGEEFDRRRDRLIIKRKVEDSRSANHTFDGAAHYEFRKKRSQYINRVGGMVDWITSAVCKNTPRVVIRNIGEANPEQIQFWTRLNLDADMEGTPFSSMVRVLVRDELVTGIPSLEISQDDGEPRIMRVEPAAVLDWTDEMVKCRFVSYDRPSELLSPNRQKHTFIFFTEHDVVCYVAYKDLAGENWVDENGAVIAEEEAVGRLDTEDSTYGHGLDIPPLCLSRGTGSQWMMDRVADPVKALFNAELDLSFALAQAAYPQPYFVVNNPGRVQDLVQSEMAVFLLLPGEEFGYKSPDNSAFDSLFRNVDRLKVALHESIQLASKDAGSLPQAGRLSAEAIQKLQNPLETLLRDYTWPIRDMLMKALQAIKKYRGDENLEIDIENFGEVIITPEDEKDFERIVKGGVSDGRNDPGSIGGGDGGEADRDAETEGDTVPQITGSDDRIA